MAKIRGLADKDGLSAFVARLKPCLIGLEACGGAHHWVRVFKSHGHTGELSLTCSYAHLILSRGICLLNVVASFDKIIAGEFAGGGFRSWLRAQLCTSRIHL